VGLFKIPCLFSLSNGLWWHTHYFDQESLSLWPRDVPNFGSDLWTRVPSLSAWKVLQRLKTSLAPQRYPLLHLASTHHLILGKLVHRVKALKALVDVAEGDLRKAIMYLQSLSRLYRQDTVTLDAVTEMAGVVPQVQVQSILEAWMSKDPGQIERRVTAFVREGFSATQLLSQVCVF
jgi:hypothetical protein